MATRGSRGQAERADSRPFSSTANPRTRHPQVCPPFEIDVEAHPTMQLRRRLLTAGIGLPLATAAICFDAPFLVMVLFLQGVCLMELDGLLARMSAARALRAALGAEGSRATLLLLHVMTAAAILANLWGTKTAWLASTLLRLFLVLRRMLLVERQHSALAAAPSSQPGASAATVMEQGLVTLAVELTSTLTVVGGWSSLVRLRFSPSGGPGALLFLLGVCFNTDNGGLLFGSLFGKKDVLAHAVPQRMRQALLLVSPNKSWTGLLGGLLLGTSTALVLPRVTCHMFDEPPPTCTLPMGTGLAVGLMVSGAAIVGDLVESWLKRAAQVKDSGTFFPGHGGCLDRLDSVLLAAPLAEQLLRRGR